VIYNLSSTSYGCRGEKKERKLLFKRKNKSGNMLLGDGERTLYSGGEKFSAVDWCEIGMS
jgi:hypothetical protein